jgi:hypothetical protein
VPAIQRERALAPSQVRALRPGNTRNVGEPRTAQGQISLQYRSMPDNPTHDVPKKDDFEPPPDDTWWLYVPGSSVILVLDVVWQAIFPHERWEAELQYCHYYRIGPIPKGKHARIKISGNEARAPNYGAVELFVTPQGQPLPPGPNISPRSTFGGDGETSVYGGAGGTLTLHQAKQFPVPGPAPTKVVVTFEDD